jgi:hypothetical protein
MIIGLFIGKAPFTCLPIGAFWIMKEPESKPNYWSVVGLLLWSAVILLAAYVVGHFIFGRW